jgi:plastocyanin
MAKERKGQERASRKPPQWRSPAAVDITPGDTLQFYSMDNRFTFRVLSVEHGGEWIFGRDTRDQDERVGPIAVKRTDCMTLETATRVLRDLPGVNLDGPVLDDEA